MWVRFQRQDIRTIAHFLGVLIVGVGILMSLPLATAIVFREWGPAIDYLFAIGVCLSVGGALRLAQIRPRHITRPQALVVVGMAWLVVSLVGAIPLYLSGHWASFLDAVFEAVSGFTTTGFSLVNDLDHLAHSHNMWRHLMQLAGGHGILVVALSFAFVGRLGGTASLYQAEGRDEHVVPNIMHTARLIWIVTGVIVAVAAVMLFIVNLSNGMGVERGGLHALWLAATAYDTGGFSPQSMGALYYHSGVFEVVVTLVIMAGMMNFALHAHLWRGNWREIYKNIETKTLLFALVGFSLLTFLAFAGSDLLNGVSPMFRKGVFHVISANSSTGFQTVYPSQWGNIIPSGAAFAIILAMGFGGAVSSTAGGIKAMRIGLIAKSIATSIRAALAPESAVVKARYHHIVERVLTPVAAANAGAIFILYVLSYTLGTAVGVAHGYDLRSALFESVSAAANSGLTSGIVSASMPLGLKLTYLVQMWLGRLEFIALLALIAGIAVSIVPRRKVR